MRHASSGVRSRSGLTLLETLAAVVLLAMTAAACAAALRDLRAHAEGAASGAGTSAGGAELVARALLDDPGRLGLESLEQIAFEAVPLTPEPELESSLDRLRQRQGMGDGAADGKPMRLDAWRVSSRAPIGTLGSPDQFWATRTGGSSPCWMVIGCDGDIATRCVLLSGERVP